MNSDSLENNSGRLQPGSYISEHMCVIEFLGSGGMSDVYKCQDESLSRVVAVKSLKAGFTDEALRRLQTEGRAIGSLSHPNIVQLHGLRFGFDSFPLLVMEYVDGVSLDTLLKKEGALQIVRSLRIALQIAEGLQVAQSQGIIHRDLKPSNIMIVNAGALDEKVKILDFGIAKIQTEVSAKATQTGVAIGTPQYMSPEQALGKKCDGRSDQYSLGCLLFEMLSGRPPYQYDNLVAIMIAHAKEQPALLNKVMKTSPPPRVQTLVSRLLQKAPEDRYESMSAVAQEIFKASTQNSLAFGRGIGIALGIVTIVAGILIFNLQGFKHQDISAHVANSQAKKTGEMPALSIDSNTSAAVESPPSKSASDASQLTDGDKEILRHASEYIRSRELLDMQNKTELTDAGLAAMIRGRQFIIANLRKCNKLTSVSVKSLTHLPLVVLDVGYTSVDDSAANTWAQMPLLETLTLKELTVTNKTCDKLVTLPHLKTLTLAATDIDGDGLTPLARIKTLIILDLEGTKVTGGLKNLKDSSVVDLVLSGVPLTQSDFDDGILKMKRIRALRFDATRISPAQFFSLTRLKNLDHIAVDDCPELTFDDLLKFHKELPQCLISQNMDLDQSRLKPTVSASQLTGPELLLNGGFDQGPFKAADQRCMPGFDTVPRWWVEKQFVRLVDNSVVAPASGVACVGLKGDISQKFSTKPGAKYCVRVKAAPCPDPDPERIKNQSFEIRVGSSALRYVLPGKRNSKTNMGWTEYVWTFVATEPESVLTFSAPLTHNPLPPYIDSVSVRKMIEK